MKAQKRITYRYSEAFKSQVVKEVEDGVSTISEVRRKYGIPGDDTVQQWIKRMGKLALLSKVSCPEIHWSFDEEGKFKDCYVKSDI